MLMISRLELALFLLFRVCSRKKDARFDDTRNNFWKFLVFWVFQVGRCCCLLLWPLLLLTFVATAAANGCGHCCCLLLLRVDHLLIAGCYHSSTTGVVGCGDPLITVVVCCLPSTATAQCMCLHTNYRHCFSVISHQPLPVLDVVTPLFTPSLRTVSAHLSTSAVVTHPGYHQSLPLGGRTDHHHCKHSISPTECHCTHHCGCSLTPLSNHCCSSTLPTDCCLLLLNPLTTAVAHWYRCPLLPLHTRRSSGCTWFRFLSSGPTRSLTSIPN
jgi:hypothetical protein